MEEESEDGVSGQVVKFDMTDWQFELKKNAKVYFFKIFLDTVTDLFNKLK